MLDKTKQFSVRFRDKLVAQIVAECERRKLPTYLDLVKGGYVDLALADHVHNKRQGEHIALLTAGGWAKYSKRWMSNMGWTGARRDLAILGGIGRQGPWAARVPSSCTNVASALAWLTPASVRAAERDGKQVLRQGDVWLVERPSGVFDLNDLPASHTWNWETGTLTHEGHGSLVIPFAFKAVPQRTLAFDGRRRRRAD